MLQPHIFISEAAIVNDPSIINQLAYSWRCCNASGLLRLAGTALVILTLISIPFPFLSIRSIAHKRLSRYSTFKALHLSVAMLGGSCHLKSHLCNLLSDYRRERYFFPHEVFHPLFFHEERLPQCFRPCSYLRPVCQ